MVMKRNMMRKNLYQSILKSLGRYIAIVAIIALGASLFVGLLMTKSDMVATGQRFMDETNMFDLRLISTYGWDLEDVDQIAQMDGIVDAEGLIYLDLVVRLGDSTEDAVYRFYSIPERINRLELRSGRMPQAPNECVTEGYNVDESILGTTVTVAVANDEDSLDSIRYETYTIVGLVATPMFMDMNRGTTSVGSGSITGNFYVPREAFDVDYYTEIHVTLSGDYAVYSDAYNQAMEVAAEELEPQLIPIAEERVERLRVEAEEAYAEGFQEYLDGRRKFEQAKREGEQELADAQQELLDAQTQLDNAEAQINSGEAQLAEAKQTLQESEEMLEAARLAFDLAKDTAYAPLVIAENQYLNSYASVAGELDAVNGQIAGLDAQIQDLTAGIAGELDQLNALDAQISQLDNAIYGLDVSIQSTQYALDAARLFPLLNAQLIPQLESAIATMNSQRSDYVAQRDALIIQRNELAATIEGPLEDIQALQAQREELVNRKSQLEQNLVTIEGGLQDIADARAALDAEFAGTEAQLADAEQQLADGYRQISEMEQQLAAARSQVESGRQELADGWVAYEEGKLEFETEIAKAEQELDDGAEELRAARKTIDAMAANVFVLDRNSNVGYNSLDSSSNIVQGVSRVFPAFFLLVAALVCITTMTRMIDEERTQIGTLKALGYSNWAIISKYLFYAGSGAVVGCGLGVLAGSAVFPKILWEAYKIMLYIRDDIVLQVNWPLCAVVVGTYTVVMLLVTWYCCRRTLQEVPAELIRPKAPDAGKKILLEYLPIWQKVSFLNKVTIRNIFRYRQRLAMMLVGIGGCTALLVTGFGLRDSIVNVVNYQFEEVTFYDMTVYFDGGVEEKTQQNFRIEIGSRAEHLMFYHQSSVELEFDHHTKEIYMISGDSQLYNFIDFHADNQQLHLPGLGEMLLSVGTAEALGIQVGDTVQLRNADMQVMDLTVSGIYENHVENYCIVAPETIQSQWGALPEQQMAFIKAAEGVDVHALSAEISGMQEVMNVSVSQDFADMIANMMAALDMVVVVIVFSAGLLAVTVLYNLTNININERMREIATIKVLGFNAWETAAYVFKENLALTVIGSGFGLGLGYLLLLFVMSQVKIDMVWFKTVVMPMSYVWAVVLTILSALLVDFLFYFKLDKINMAEALKSVE